MHQTATQAKRLWEALLWARSSSVPFLTKLAARSPSGRELPRDLLCKLAATGFESIPDEATGKCLKGLLVLPFVLYTVITAGLCGRWLESLEVLTLLLHLFSAQSSSMLIENQAKELRAEEKATANCSLPACMCNFDQSLPF